MIQYQISPLNPNSHLFEVILSFSSVAGENYTLSLPAWLPGSYMIRDFAKNITEINALDGNKQSIELEKVDKQTWSLQATDAQVEVRYQIFAFDLSVRTAYLDSQRGFFNGSSTFLQVQELNDLPCQLTIQPSTLAAHSKWRVATGLTRAKTTEKYQFGQYIADNYQHLIDCPVAIGEFDSTEFTVEGVVHHLVFTSKHYGDTQRLAADVSALCQHHINLFGEAPFKEYWFITHLLANGFGGLEHKNSTILQASRFDLPNPHQPTAERHENYKTFLSLCSHEYFHAWNVCRIKPKEFVPYNLKQESYTKQLWAFEGITSYYDDFSLYRTGLINFEEYLAILAKTATRVYRGKGELKQSITASSFDAWTKFYQQGPDAINNIVSYYAKGALIALWLDLTIRSKSNNQYSLDTLMRELWIHFGRTSVGTSEDDFINIANILCAEDISSSFKHHLYSNERIDLTAELASYGVELNKQKFKKLNSLETTSATHYHGYLGAQYKAQALGLNITQVLEGSPAAKAGLAVNDTLIAVDKMKVTEPSIQALFDHLTVGSSITCDFFRDDQLLTTTLDIIDSPLTGVAFTVVDNNLVKNWQAIIQ
ncbi:M61 family peptidase [Colwellia sp. Arc7-635]|uniref:M61 family metallopeptidase n=1 Tax=Colwellia sp. Arc7-635 TaxID=2497879 RepID=UPI000F84ED12|nr:PDZ domain-containing protein [Colwellia sp. Arc7-635]AZQ85921.1 M61 family peptidase [Colwellia sp. Arc7-635]